MSKWAKLARRLTLFASRWAGVDVSRSFVNLISGGGKRYNLHGPDVDHREMKNPAFHPPTTISAGKPIGLKVDLDQEWANSCLFYMRKTLVEHFDYYAELYKKAGATNLADHMHAQAARYKELDSVGLHPSGG